MAEVGEVQAAPLALERQVAGRLAGILEDERGGDAAGGEADRMRRPPPCRPLVPHGEAVLAADRLLEEVEDHCMTMATRPVTLRSSSACIAFGASSSGKVRSTCGRQRPASHQPRM